MYRLRTYGDGGGREGGREGGIGGREGGREGGKEGGRKGGIRGREGGESEESYLNRRYIHLAFEKYTVSSCV